MTTSMAEASTTSCANCGKGEEFETKLKTCNACKLVKYCGRDCQIAHRPHHKNACKKRAAELHDEALFMQPPRQDDCPICFLPLPGVETGHRFRACCGKSICTGCSHEHYLQSSGSPTCPFCRADPPSDQELLKLVEKRGDSNDARALYLLGMLHNTGDEGWRIERDVDKAVELFHRAAELGYASAYHDLGVMYADGDGVSKDETKANQYSEKAAMAGCVVSR
jgi:TPR repeat protein